MSTRTDISRIYQIGIYMMTTLLILGASSLQASAKDIVRDTVRETVKVYYRLNKYDLDPAFHNNKSRLDSLVIAMGDSSRLRKVTKIEVIGGASPEGSVKLNNMLSHKRAGSFIDYLDEYVEIPDSIITYTFLGRDWNGLRKFILADPNVPFKDEVMEVMDEITSQNEITDEDGPKYLRRLSKIGGGKAYDYIYQNIFPALRESRFIVHYIHPKRFRLPAKLRGDLSLPLMAQRPNVDYLFYQDLSPVTNIMEEIVRRPFYMALKTNMLYDALAVPNLSAEFYLGKNWSIAGEGMYAWWSYDRRHRYWRIYGGDIVLRRWFGKAANNKPLTGHHLGINAGVLTFDFEWGGEGYLGGKPRGTLLDRCLYTAGVEYGYSLPVANRFNIDFSLGVGYFGGKYYKYEPFYDTYLKTGEYRISYFGPTKAEISLVWLIGRGNTNKKKGGDL